MPRIVNSTEFKKQIRNKVVVVDFFAKWCKPCKLISPIFEEVESEYKGKATFIKVDLDRCNDLVNRYRISSIPTIMVFKNGKVVATKTGFINKHQLKKLINPHI